MHRDLDKNLQRQLRDSEEDLDAATLTRLREARQQAIAAAGKPDASRWRSNWMPAAAVATVCCMAVLIALWRDPLSTPDDAIEVVDAQQPAPPTAAPALTELEAALLMAADAEDLLVPADNAADSENAEELLDLYENLEFYEWLMLEDLDESRS